MPNTGNIVLFLPLVLAGALAFARPSTLVFMLLAGVAMMTGLYSPDILSSDGQTTFFSMAVGLILVGFSLVSISFAYRYIFWEPKCQ